MGSDAAFRSAKNWNIVMNKDDGFDSESTIETDKFICYLYDSGSWKTTH